MKRQAVRRSHPCHLLAAQLSSTRFPFRSPEGFPFRSQVADFWLAKLLEEGPTQRHSSCASGTYGYVALEYALYGQVKSPAINSVAILSETGCVAELFIYCAVLGFSQGTSSSNQTSE